MSSIFQVMPLYAWIIIGCVIVFAVVVLIKMKFFTKTREPSGELSPDPEDSGKGMAGMFFAGKRKSKNMKKRRKYKK